jgi:diguanylate cyclase (GGDEF)-like protein/PAS domain S-box-containing protein
MSTVSRTQLQGPNAWRGRLGCAVFRADGSLRFANAGFAALLGYEADALSGINLAQLAGSEVVEHLRLGARRGEIGLDCSFVGRDGAAVCVHVDASGSPDGDLVLQLVGVEDEQSEMELELSESRLNFALDAAGQGVWDHDVSSNTMYYSPGWRQMRGIPLGEAVDGAVASWMERVHPDDRGQILSILDTPTPGADGFRMMEYRERHRLGHYIWIQSRGRAVAWDENGVTTRTLGTDTDITERKERELEFEIISQRLELALEVSQIGVWEQNLDTGDVIWDRRMHEIYGRQQIEALSSLDWELALHPADLQRAKDDFSAAVRTRSDYLSEFRIIMPDGRIRHIRSRGRYFAASVGEGKLVGAEWDITHDVERAEQLYDARLLAEARFEELQKAQKRIRHAAMHDHLTDLPNRRYLDEKLAASLTSLDAHGRRLAVLHIDLDWFKEINDRFGHAAGDFVLQHVAGVLRRNCRDDDFIARVGGDEFVVLSWFGESDSALRTTASRIIEALGETIAHGDIEMKIGASIGIAYSGGEPVSASALLQRADVALYRAKALGRNRFELAALQAA